MKQKFTILSLLIVTALSVSFLIFNNPADQFYNVLPKKTKVSGAFEAMQLWNLVRAYPGEVIPAASFSNAFEVGQQLRLRKNQFTSNTDVWVPIGPHNTAGRTNALAFNPQNHNTLYAGSASGGLWRSYSGGVGVNAWHYVSTGFPVLGVSSIAIEPGDSNTIFIGTGEVYNYDGAGHGGAYRNLRGTYGIGILKTTDGGQTWTKSLDWSYESQRGVWAIKINPLNPNTVFANTTEGVYRSYNAGVSWQQISNVIMGTDLVINPADTNIIISSHGNFASTGFGIYRSTNAGNNWSQITSGLPAFYEGKILLDIYNSNPNIVYASIGNGFSSANGASWLCRSTNAGLTWTIMSTQDYSQHQGWFSHDAAIDQWNSNNLIVIGIAVWKSINGGSTLIQKSDGGLTLGRPPVGGPEGGPGYTHADAHVVVQHPTNQNIFYIGTDGGVFRTTDLGETFTSCNGRLQTTQFYNGSSSSQTDSLVSMGGLQDNSTVIYDGDLAWTRTIGGDGSWTSIDPTNDNKMYASWQFLNMLRSTNGGNSFSTITPPGGSNPTAFIAPFKSFSGNSNILYAGRDRIYKSTNSGTNWSVTNSNLVLDGNFAFAMEISYQNSEKVFVATAPSTSIRGHIFRTINGGTNWTDITGSLPDRFPADLSVDPNDDNILYLTFYGFGNPHVFKTINSGDSWTNISDNLPDIPTPSVIVDPNNSNHIYVGTDVGVFVSTTGGGSWQDFNDGLPDAVQAMDLNITVVNDVLRVMTHGNGAYERKLLSSVIPVELKSFNAAVINGTVKLQWTTATETNNLGFDIERTSPLPSPYQGAGGPDFIGRGGWEKIGFISGHGTTTETNDYSFVDRNVQPGSYSYRLKQIDFDGTFEYSPVVEVIILAPEDFALSQNYPNPFNPITNIGFRIANSGFVSLKIYDMLGNELSTLISKEMNAEEYEIEFDGTGFPSGTYFYRLEAGNYTETKKMVLLK